MASKSAVGILSLGEMGMGISRLLVAHKYPVITSLQGRSKATKERLQSSPASIKIVDNDHDLVNASNVILSIVPPRDAYNTAKRIHDAVVNQTDHSSGKKELYVMDLNAISPASSRKIYSDFFEKYHDVHAQNVGGSRNIVYIDGGIIGSPPRQDPNTSDTEKWTRPLIPLSGMILEDSSSSGLTSLLKILNAKHISKDIGAASGLKMCFASLTKGFTALAIQSFTTAHRLGCLEDLKDAMTQYNPRGLETAERGIVGMVPKAYRWVNEMEEIASTFRVDGGFEKGDVGEGGEVFEGIARVYDFVANRTEFVSDEGRKRKGGDLEGVLGEFGRCLESREDDGPRKKRLRQAE